MIRSSDKHAVDQIPIYLWKEYSLHPDWDREWDLADLIEFLEWQEAQWKTEAVTT